MKSMRVKAEPECGVIISQERERERWYSCNTVMLVDHMLVAYRSVETLCEE